MMKKAGRPKGSLNKPKLKAVEVPSTMDILTKNEYKHLRDEIDRRSVRIQASEQSEHENRSEQICAIPQTKIKKIRTSQERKARKSSNFLFKRIALMKNIRKSRAAFGKCQFKISGVNCNRPAKFVTLSRLKAVRFCELHAPEKLVQYPDLIDEFGSPLLNSKSKDSVVLVDADSWRSVENNSSFFKENIKSYIPFTPRRPNAFIHIKVMDMAFKMASIGISADRIWEIICRDFVTPLPKNLETQFRDVLHEYCSLKVLNQELQIEEIGFPENKRNWGFYCHCCFSDQEETRQRILILDACFTKKRFKSSGESAGSPRLDHIYYLNTPESLEFKATADKSCSNFLAGDEKLKSKSGLDVNGVFGAVCPHGFPYHFIDVPKGESLDYAVMIARNFNREFPKAKLTIAYDIGCKLIGSLEAANVKYDKLFLPVFHSYAHDLKCRSKFSPKYMMGIGIEDGENMERLWSQMPYACHSRYMRPETRRDFITIFAHTIAVKSYKNLPESIGTKMRRSLLNLGMTKSEYKTIKLIEIDKCCLEYLNQYNYVDLNKTLISIKLALINDNSQSDDIKQSIRQYIDMLARSKISRDSKSYERSGTKGAAMSKRTKRSVDQSFYEAVEQFNTRFGENLSASSVLDSLKTGIIDDDLENSIICWKSIEQLSICYDDLNSSIKSLNKVSKEMLDFSKPSIDQTIVELLKQRIHLNNQIVTRLKALKIVCFDALSKLQTYHQQITHYTDKPESVN